MEAMRALIKICSIYIDGLGTPLQHELGCMVLGVSDSGTTSYKASFYLSMIAYDFSWARGRL